jgi:glycolate oxidase
MAIPRMAYKMLEAVVGVEDVSEDPAVTYAYSINFPDDCVLLNFPPVDIQAVVLPESTEEVQAIVRICNEYKITYVPIGTHLGPWCTGGTIVIDPKKMNKFWIDERNMYAVIEPYTTHAQVQAEAMKKGLVHNTPTAGAHCSALCNFLFYGSTLTSYSLGLSGRNVLGIEWVLPDGDLLKLGSLGSGAGWFCGDGPGPSLRSLMRGICGNMGGLGMVTKVAIKLFPWAGPRTFSMSGVPPDYVAEFPEDQLKLFLVTFPSWEKMADFAYEMGKAEVGFSLWRLPPGGAARLMTTCNEGYYDLWSSGLFQEELGTHPKGTILIVLQGSPAIPLDYEERVLRQIVAETGGTFPSEQLVKDLRKRYTPEVVRPYICQAWTFMTGRYHSVKITWDSVDDAIAYGTSALALKKEYIEAGTLMDDGADCCWVNSVDFTHFGLEEQEYVYDPASPESMKAALDIIVRASEDEFGKKVYVTSSGDMANKIFGPQMSNFHIWMMKIKKAFDPNVLSNPPWFIIPEEEENP